MKQVVWNSLSPAEQGQILQRPAVNAGPGIQEAVSAIIRKVQQGGDEALRRLTAQFDQITPERIQVSEETIGSAGQYLADDLKDAMGQAYVNIKTFHQAQALPALRVETQPGVVCEQITRPIESVGCYIPGGSAPLFSTVLMLGIPALLAGCTTVVLCSPPPIANEILFAAELCGITQVYNAGGAQAIAAMAYGTDSVPKVDKIFGPGNAFVTAAKQQVSADPQGAAIDMPAGPSEVMVIADSSADPEFVAADLLSQAEHGVDSQVVLVTPNTEIAKKTAIAVQQQLTALPRAAIAEQALAAGVLIVTDTLSDCVAIANRYGPEHLIIQTETPRTLLPRINNAGSVFLGAWSPESAGDYASGTNHVLPTYGHSRTSSSLGLADFSRRMTVQELSPAGFSALAPTVSVMAAAEGLDAHQRAVTIRQQKYERGRS
ncbi:histidinol dehydrogenase [Candidatus Sororendozoicomonas aggregata]|uniref:histidinol dehydrogenase n=1 Tax=Candidatus Sororendozoicomonas aggregata TaxID=3073239 RepID=UPI002ED38FE8